MPGRCVPNVLDYLKASIQEETYEKLTSFQSNIFFITYMVFNSCLLFFFKFLDLIIEKMSSKSKVDQPNEPINETLIEEIKSIGLNAKNHLKK